MATAFLSTANLFLCSSRSSSLSSHTTAVTVSLRTHKQNAHCKRQLVTSCRTFCSESSTPLSSPILTKRSLSVCFITSFVFSLAGKGGNPGASAAVLEADDDEELLERVKRDRKKRLERQGVISSSNKETGYLQDLVYKLSKVGQAIDNNDLSAASSLLGGSTDTDWVQKANLAFTTLSYSPEEKMEVDTFNSSLASLISSVTRNDIESSKVAFVASAAAFEKWTTLTGLVGQLKGL